MLSENPENNCQIIHNYVIISGQPYDNHSNRRELRRPMGGDEDLARGMARMDPFAYGGGGNGGTGGRYGMQNQFDPPRPAPNADGWSSGDDYLAWNDQTGGGQEVQQGYGSGGQGQPGQQHPGQQHPGQQQNSNNQFRTPAQSRLNQQQAINQQHYQQRQQQQQQQQWNQAAQQAQWNIAANEFVPK